MIRIHTGLVMLLALINITAFSQTSGAPLTKTFSSFEGGYILDLPWTAQFIRSGPLEGEDAYSPGKGHRDQWSAGDVSLESAFIEFEKDSKVPRDSLGMFEEAVRLFSGRMEADGWTLSYDRAVIARGGAGRELFFEGGDRRQLVRWFFHEGRAVRVRAAFVDDGENRKVAERFLDSVRLASRDEIAAMKIKEAAPVDLPQTAPDRPAQWLRPDAEELAKGAKVGVKSIFEEIENTGQDAQVRNRQKKIDYYFDLRGFLTRTVTYDPASYPYVVTTYGFLDGKRVNKNAVVPNDNIGMGMTPPIPGQPVRKRDPRYSTRVEEKYDSGKRLAERLFYDNAGDLFLRAVYSYRDNRVEIYEYKKTGTLENKFSQLLDAKGNLAQKTAQSFGSAPNERKYVYKYLTFDDRGNWTKRTVSLEIKENGKITTLDYTEYRTIAYY
ncbi:MAG TPA: hypothetical protein VGO50_20240 [Pyrinomonadaceae bacterium]|jgi:hypothetical protein|nr:hypothetical protein [Pyrinomonadaceae bacterium]